MCHKRDVWALVLIALVSAVLSAGCVEDFSDSSDVSIQYYMIQIDSIQAPDTISHDDALVLRFWGEVGRSGCYSFVHFDISWRGSVLIITARGKYTAGKPCHQGAVSLWGEPLAIESPPQGKLGIVVHQPDGSELRDSVLVQ